MNDYELYHYGVKGMKWGIRRTAAQLGHVVGTGYKKAKTAAGNIKAKRDAKKAEKIKQEREKITSSRKLTDEELKSRIQRLQLEKNYQDLVKDTSKLSRGEEFVLGIMETVGRELITQAGKHYGAKFGNKIIGEEALFANNKKK